MFLQSSVSPHISNSNSFVPISGSNSLLQTLQVIDSSLRALKASLAFTNPSLSTSNLSNLKRSFSFSSFGILISPVALKTS
ncbi:uncharacterized protein METZ01_LOCUS186410 [marine metagenome]|uniref:Uncharacterized protein n=1 Tax=marine metagenome TaxID=408172 RepID=A0A382D4X2_9ZZZZ